MNVQKIANRIVAALWDVYRFKNLGGGFSGVSIHEDFRTEGLFKADVGVYSSDQGGKFTGELGKGAATEEELREKMDKEIAEAAKKFDDEVGRIMQRYGFKGS